MNICFHCHDNCVEEIQFDEHVFCCVGCKTVYEILQGNTLSNFYKIDDEAGVRPNAEIKGRFDYLDLAEFQSKLIVFQDGSITKIKLFLPQIHCSSCLWLLERLHKINPGVIQSQVKFVEKEVSITYDADKISMRQLAELLATIGYSPSITLKEFDKKEKNQMNKKLVQQIGVAGFCFGNIMLLSFPEYLGINRGDQNFISLFNGLNLVLSLPVLIYGAKDYLISAYSAIRSKRINIDVPISLGILSLYSQSLYEVVSGTGAGYFDSFAGLIFFLLIGKWFQQQTYRAINFERDYESYFPISVTKVVNNKEEIIPLKSVQIGDELMIRNGEIIPADGILKSKSAKIDYSFVSGEADLIDKFSGDQLFAGGRLSGLAIRMEISKQVENSYLTELWNNPIFNKKETGANLTDTISKYFTWAILGLAILSGGFWMIRDSSQALFVMISILIVACPCALALSAPFTFGNAIRILGRKHFYMRNVEVIETMNEIDTVVLDKTGTITENEKSELVWEGEELSEIQKSVIASIVRQSAHPMSRKIAAILKDNALVELIKHNEVAGSGITAELQGEVWKVGSYKLVDLSDSPKQSSVYIQCNGTVLGRFVFHSSYRKGMREMFMTLGEKYEIHVLSGDNDAETERLTELIPNNASLNFNCQPNDKLVFIENLQKKGKKTMMIGDGLNDAGALRQADVGISIVDDIYAFSPASDAILKGDNLIKLNNYFDFAKYSIRVVRYSYIFSFAYNIVGLSFAISGNLTPLVAAILMPLSSISVVILVTLLTNLKGRVFLKDKNN
ncbi:heavy metal translocating P-type ATPase [Crocinitomix catalasitica]|uniref:heavy metal translocating P-type ATPase n=1 Tax=Crocinitomix catalasitica TaxID=184607 RepID=UPI00055CD2AD|nr:heavy metal translocating P-type ATPase metal-binding domain-containing protein [Crocinitomix catalasitica]